MSERSRRFFLTLIGMAPAAFVTPAKAADIPTEPHARGSVRLAAVPTRRSGLLAEFECRIFDGRGWVALDSPEGDAVWQDMSRR